jgi:hypothetical protein
VCVCVRARACVCVCVCVCVRAYMHVQGRCEFGSAQPILLTQSYYRRIVRKWDGVSLNCDLLAQSPTGWVLVTYNPCHLIPGVFFLMLVSSSVMTVLTSVAILYLERDDHAHTETSSSMATQGDIAKVKDSSPSRSHGDPLKDSPGAKRRDMKFLSHNYRRNVSIYLERTGFALVIVTIIVANMLFIIPNT